MAIQQGLQNYDVNITVTIHIYYPPHVHRPDVELTTASDGSTTGSRRLLQLESPSSAAGGGALFAPSMLPQSSALLYERAISSQLGLDGLQPSTTPGTAPAVPTIAAAARQSALVLEELLAAVQAKVYQLEPQPSRVQILTGIMQQQLNRQRVQNVHTACVTCLTHSVQHAEQGACQVPIDTAGANGSNLCGPRRTAVEKMSLSGSGLQPSHQGRHLLQTTGLITSLTSLQGSMATNLGATSVSQQTQGQEVDMVAVRLRQKPCHVMGVCDISGLRFNYCA